MTGVEANLSNQEGSNHSGRSPLMNHIPRFEWGGTGKKKAKHRRSRRRRSLSASCDGSGQQHKQKQIQGVRHSSEFWFPVIKGAAQRMEIVSIPNVMDASHTKTVLWALVRLIGSNNGVVESGSEWC